MKASRQTILPLCQPALRSLVDRLPGGHVAARLAVLALLAGAGLTGGAHAFDGSAQSTDEVGRSLTPPANVPLAPPTRPVDEAFRTGTQALRLGQTAKGVDALRYAADQGHPAAQWKLGRMYADGDGVKRDDLKAFEYFSRVANSHAEDYPGTPQARFVASAFVALGSYYLVGIPNTGVRKDPNRARDMYAYAASYFGDPVAQYRLAKLYLDGTGVNRDPRQAARWLILSAQKGQYEAQAVLGHMLFRGEDGIPRQGARGLMWLTLARDSAAGPEDKWVVELYDEAFADATPDERAQALRYLEQWLKTAQR
ncbi:tetratricopeptide repeat protein [Aquabacter sediminis]|uniref:tetratricopeptide repeat protein n=1 Tax=Aquabacter sediminis TaxID=3029197 RepID=UPI00237D60B2|nr:tetratricopeptide repeat protein [Aquabacter sp. P-9]MDE1570310.1 tetratricopeptide repeat protein [Aquabacter sp. P-9]